MMHINSKNYSNIYFWQFIYKTNMLGMTSDSDPPNFKKRIFLFSIFNSSILLSDALSIKLPL